MLRAALIAVLAASVWACASAPAGSGATAPVDDAAITARVRNALFEEARLSSVDVKVNTYRGVVLLSGFVDSQGDVERAGEVARGVRGVSRIDNALLVRPKN